MSLDLSWQVLPPNLARAVRLQCLTVAEATSLWDHHMQAPLGPSLLPPHLWPAAERLWLLEVQLQNPRQH
mgnify:CR=1 FL=1